MKHLTGGTDPDPDPGPGLGPGPGFAGLGESVLPQEVKL